MKDMRNIYVVYDIRDDDLRNVLSNILMQYGLHRVQYSVFNGVLTLAEKEEMVKSLMGLEFGSEDKVHIIDMCRRCFRNVILIGEKERSSEHLVL